MATPQMAARQMPMPIIQVSISQLPIPIRMVCSTSNRGITPHPKLCSSFPPSSLLNGITFPSFDHIVYPPTYPSGIQPLTYHSAFVARFMRMKHMSSERTDFVVVDRDRNEVQIRFYANIFTRKAATIFDNIQEGNTIVVLYPRKAQFDDKTWGVLLNERDIKNSHVRIIPCELQDLMLGNNSYWRLISGKTRLKCDYCVKSFQDIEQLPFVCGKCNMTRYCSAECVASDCEENHKAWCRIYRELSWFTKKDWAKVEYERQSDEWDMEKTVVGEKNSDDWVEVTEKDFLEKRPVPVLFNGAD